MGSLEEDDVCVLVLTLVRKGMGKPGGREGEEVEEGLVNKMGYGNSPTLKCTVSEINNLP